VDYPTATTWQVTISNMTEGANTVTITATDIHGLTSNPKPVTILLDTVSPIVTVDSPVTGSATNNTLVSYTINETLAAGQIEFIRTGGATDNAAHVYPLSAAQRTVGSQSVLTGMTLVNGTIYTVTITKAVDQAGNAAVVTPSTNVTFDTRSVGVTSVTPALKTIMTDGNVGFTLSENAASGTITFTRSGGAPDPASPHNLTLSTPDLIAGAHMLDTGFTLVDDTFYTVTLRFKDRAANPDTVVSNTMVFFDQDYGQGPVGNVDNDDKQDVVNSDDEAKMENTMGSKPGDTNWNPVCDLNKDGKIDQKDMLLLRMHLK